MRLVLVFRVGHKVDAEKASVVVASACAGAVQWSGRAAPLIASALRHGSRVCTRDATPSVPRSAGADARRPHPPPPAPPRSNARARRCAVQFKEGARTERLHGLSEAVPGQVLGQRRGGELARGLLLVDGAEQRLAEHQREDIGVRPTQTCHASSVRGLRRASRQMRTSDALLLMRCASVRIRGGGWWRGTAHPQRPAQSAPRACRRCTHGRRSP